MRNRTCEFYIRQWKIWGRIKPFPINPPTCIRLMLMVLD